MFCARTPPPRAREVDSRAAHFPNWIFVVVAAAPDASGSLGCAPDAHAEGRRCRWAFPRAAGAQPAGAAELEPREPQLHKHEANDRFSIRHHSERLLSRSPCDLSPDR